MIRKIDRTDFDRVMEIQWQSYRDPWPLEALSRRVKRDRLVLLVLAKKVAGFATYYWERGTLVCDRLAICVSFRRRGLGTQLLEAVEAKAERAKFIWVLAEEYQLDGQLFLRSNGYRGFEKDGRYVFERETLPYVTKL